MRRQRQAARTEIAGTRGQLVGLASEADDHRPRERVLPSHVEREDEIGRLEGVWRHERLVEDE